MHRSTEMAVQTLMQMPDVIECGDTLRVQLGFGNYPPASYSAALKFNIAGTAPTSVAGTAATSTDFLFVLSAATSAAMAAGSYDYAIRVTETSSGETATAQTGTITFLPNLGATLTKSTVEQQYDAANTALLSLLANKNSSVSFNGQSFTKENQMSLVDIISRLKARLDAERAEQAGLRGQGKTRSIAPFFQ